MERLWIREVRRAARRASAPFARQVALGCAAAAVGTIAASLRPPRWGGSAAQAVWAAVWALAAYLVIWTGLFVSPSIRCVSLSAASMRCLGPGRTLFAYHVLQLRLCLGQIMPIHRLGETQVSADVGEVPISRTGQTT
jgi:hypothetical protein